MKPTFATKLDSSHLENSVEDIVQRTIYHLKFTQGKDQYTATSLDCYLSFALAVKDLLLDYWLSTQGKEHALNRKRVYYLSLEYLIGRSLGNAILNLDMGKKAIKALSEMGLDLSLLEESEWDAGLGNGGLGRLAACFLDSLSSLEIPAYGYGIRYEYGIFFQHIKACEQVETPDNWLRYGSVWEIPRPNRIYPVHFGGCVKPVIREDGSSARKWVPAESVMAMAYDYLIPGYKNQFVNTLRLFSAKSTRDFNLNYFNEGEYVQAVAYKNHSEIISKVLYPNDNNMQGKELRLKQEYFFVAATISDILRRFAKTDSDLSHLPSKATLQMNDTHPAIAVAELMRRLVDEFEMPWERAWQIVKATCNYTNHTILPEALEQWPVELFGSVLPRHLEIIYEINHRFLNSVSISLDAIRKVSIIQEEPVKAVRMANLAIIASRKVNGVSRLHTEILKESVFQEFYWMMPEKFISLTNGITFRRWLMLCNPLLANLLDKTISPRWRKDSNKLIQLRKYLMDAAFIEDLAKVKHQNKQEFCHYLGKSQVEKYLNPYSIFDFQAKRMHEYKRQLLNAMHIIHLIHKIREGREVYPHTFFFAGKAAPGYYTAKLIIRLICLLGEYIQKDSSLNKILKVVFLPNYRVSLAEKIMPAAEVSQQISLAGMEASGTGNMKFSLNGALTVGTLDGANIEIREAVGAENFFLFGLEADDVTQLKTDGYHPYAWYKEYPAIAEVLDFIASGQLCPFEPTLFLPLKKLLLEDGDQYCLLADFMDYVFAMQAVENSYQDSIQWNRMSAANIAGMGSFSSDETIKGYAKEVWGVDR